MAEEVNILVNIQGNALKKLSALNSKSNKTFSSMSSGALSVGGALGKVASIASKVVAGFAAMGAAATAWGFSTASAMENIEQQFVPLLGSTDAAKKRIKDLADFAAKTPFQLEGIAKASKILESLTQGALSTGDGLRMVGDAAAVSGESMDNLAIHVGRAYSNLRNNRPAGEAISRLQELGLITGKTRNEIEKVGGTAAWDLLREELEKTSGAMEGLSKTFTGRISTLKDVVSLGLADIVKKFGLFELAKKAIKRVTDAFSDFVKDADFSMIATNIVQGIKNIAPNIDGLAVTFGTLGKIVWNVGQVIFKTLKTVAGTVVNLVASIASAIASLASGDFAQAKKEMKNFGTTFIDDFTELNESITGDFEDIGDAVTNFADNYNSTARAVVKATKIVQDEIKAAKDAADTPTNVPTTTTEEDGGTPIDRAKEQAALLFELRKAETQSIKDEFDRRRELEKIAFEQRKSDKKLSDEEIETLEKIHKQNMIAIDADAKKAADEAEQRSAKIAQIESKRKEDAYISAAQTSLQAASTALKGNKKAATAQKIIDIGLIAMNTAVAISNAWKSGSYVENIIETIAIGGMGIAQAGVVASQSFSMGSDAGLVRKEVGVPSTGDRTLIRANAGEEVLTEDDPRHRNNGGGGGGTLPPIHVTLEMSGQAVSQVVVDANSRNARTGRPEGVSF